MKAKKNAKQNARGIDASIKAVNDYMKQHPDQFPKTVEARLALFPFALWMLTERKETVHAVVNLDGNMLQDLRLYRSRAEARKDFRKVRKEMERRGHIHPDCGEWEAWDGDDEETKIWEDVEVL